MDVNTKRPLYTTPRAVGTQKERLIVKNCWNHVLPKTVGGQFCVSALKERHQAETMFSPKNVTGHYLVRRIRQPKQNKPTARKIPDEDTAVAATLPPPANPCCARPPPPPTEGLMAIRL